MPAAGTRKDLQVLQSSRRKVVGGVWRGVWRGMQGEEAEGS